MRKLLVLILLFCYSVTMANPIFNQEVADTLISHIQVQLNSKESYYLINSKNHQLDSYILQEFIKESIDVRSDQTLASKSIFFSINEEVTYIPKKSFLFSRDAKQSKILAEAKVVDNLSSRIDYHVNFSKVEETSVNDGDVTLWKSVLISLMTGTLIYSLWSIE